MRCALECVLDSRIRTPGYQQDFKDPEQSDDVSEGERTERRARNAPPKLGLNFTEAAGKLVAFVNVNDDPPNWQAFQIRFTERTLLCIEFEPSHTQINVGGR